MNIQAVNNLSNFQKTNLYTNNNTNKTEQKFIEKKPIMSSLNALSNYGAANVNFGSSITENMRNEAVDKFTQYKATGENFLKKSKILKEQGDELYMEARAELDYAKQQVAEKLLVRKLFSIKNNYDGTRYVILKHASGTNRKITFEENGKNFYVLQIEKTQGNHKDVIEVGSNDSIKSISLGVEGEKSDGIYSADTVFNYKNGKLDEVDKDINKNVVPGIYAKGVIKTAKEVIKFDELGQVQYGLKNFLRDVDAKYSAAERYDYTNGQLRDIVDDYKWSFDNDSPFSVNRSFILDKNGNLSEIIKGYKLYPKSDIQKIETPSF